MLPARAGSRRHRRRCACRSAGRRHSSSSCHMVVDYNSHSRRLRAPAAADCRARPIIILIHSPLLPNPLPRSSPRWRHAAGGQRRPQHLQRRHRRNLVASGATVLPEYILPTRCGCASASAGVVVVGVTTAWLTAMHDFPGRRFFEWALVLPLAMPAYVLAYVYTDFLQFVGPLQTWLRETFGWSKATTGFPTSAVWRGHRRCSSSCSIPTSICWPHGLHRARQRHARSGAHARPRALAQLLPVSLPLARPAVAPARAGADGNAGRLRHGGLLRRADLHHRHLPRLVSLGDRVAAAQLAAALLGFVIVLLLLEQFSRGRARFHNTTGAIARSRCARCKAWRGWLATAGCALPLGIGFVLPAGCLLRWR
jgi:iron(III) transport system permease protein